VFATSRHGKPGDGMFTVIWPVEEEARENIPSPGYRCFIGVNEGKSGVNEGQPDPRDLFALWRKIAQIRPSPIPPHSPLVSSRSSFMVAGNLGGGRFSCETELAVAKTMKKPNSTRLLRTLASPPIRLPGFKDYSTKAGLLMEGPLRFSLALQAFLFSLGVSRGDVSLLLGFGSGIFHARCSELSGGMIPVWRVYPCCDSR